MSPVDVSEIHTEPAPDSPRAFMRRLRFPIMGGVVLLAVVIGLVVYLGGGRYQSTDDASVESARVSVSASIPGRVMTILVHDGQLVHKGDVLFQLDARQYQTAYDESEAALASARLQVQQLKAAYAQRQADLKAAQDNLAHLAKEADRQKALVAAGTSTGVQAADAANQADQARQQVAADQAQLANAAEALGGDPNIAVDNHPLVLQAKARLASAGLNRSYVDIIAPQDGVVTKVDQLQVGDYISAATPVFSLVSDRFWVEANFKENQLEYMREGQRASIKIDAYPDQRFDARVSAISPGTGSSFSLLPPENATGNWVKVTQRVPVRLEFVGHPDVPLEAGLSVTATVDTTHRRHLFGSAPPPPAQRPEAGAGQ